MRRIILIGILLVVGWIFKSNISSTHKVDNRATSYTYTSPAEAEDSISDEEIDAIMNSYTGYEDKLYKHQKTHNNVLKNEELISQKRKIVYTIKNKFKCDKRKHCSQMRSYLEAKYFLKHCPNVKMDGDRDGIPCERQFGQNY